VSLDFRKVTRHVHVATDDGSLGFKGNHRRPLARRKSAFDGKGHLYVYSCGPMAMLKGLSEAVSLEAVHVPGIPRNAKWPAASGVLRCVVKTKDPENPLPRVCKEGPGVLSPGHPLD